MTGQSGRETDRQKDSQIFCLPVSQSSNGHSGLEKNHIVSVQSFSLSVGQSISQSVNLSINQ